MTEYRFVLKATLKSPLHLGEGREGSATDAPLRRTAAGEVVLPGTSLAGVLRTIDEEITGSVSQCHLYKHTRGAACPCDTCSLYGQSRPSAAVTPGIVVRASRVRVFDSVIATTRTEIADSVSLDRVLRQAAKGRKFDREDVPAGSSLTVEVRLELDGDNLSTVGRLVSALNCLGRGEVPVGGRVAGGLGRLAATTPLEVSSRAFGSQSPDAFIKAITRGAGGWSPLDVSTLAIPQHARDSVISFTIRSRPESTFLVSDSAESVASGYDRAPRGGAASPQLPGSSLRGALRSAAERIARTLGGRGGACDPLGPNSCATMARLGQRATPPTQVPRCLACRLFGNEELGSPLLVQIDRQGSAKAVPFDHVAIDRFTGGQRHGLKFNVQASAEATFFVQLRLRKDAESKDLERFRALLALTVRELGLGWVTLGHGAAKGHGVFAIVENKVQGLGSDDELRAWVNGLATELGAQVKAAGDL